MPTDSLDIKVTSSVISSDNMKDNLRAVKELLGQTSYIVEALEILEKR